MDRRIEQTLHVRLRRFRLPAWFTGWYMGRIAGRYCPCEWPWKIKWLIEVCAWIDDEEERHDFTRFVGFHLAQHQTTGTSSTANVTYTFKGRKGSHGVG